MLPPNKRPVNTVFQKYALFPHLNVFDNVAFGLKLKRVETTYVDKNGETKTKLVPLTKAEIKEKVKNALETVDLAGFEKRSISTLSGGQQQRIAIARALLTSRKFLLLDEPLGALDLKMRKEMQLELKAMHEKLGITFIYVTHDQEEALTMSDTIIVMSDGCIQQIGTPEDIYNEPKNAFVADFIGESNIFTGVMPADNLVRFCGKAFPCEDGRFRKRRTRRRRGSPGGRKTGSARGRSAERQSNFRNLQRHTLSDSGAMRQIRNRSAQHRGARGRRERRFKNRPGRHSRNEKSIPRQPFFGRDYQEKHRGIRRRRIRMRRYAAV